MRLFITLFVAAAAFAQPAQLVTTANTIEWQQSAANHAVVLSLQKPNGEVVTQTFTAGSTPLLRVENLYGDGIYAYELRSDDGGIQSGSFAIMKGAILSPNRPEKPRMKVAPDTFFSDFVSAAGGLCGGADCTSTEVMGLATIKGKANNVRLKFEDTSTSAGFPTTDWQISANDTFSGGLNKLFVEDLTAATTPFTIEGAAPTNTLYVDSTGRVGIRTSTPGKTLHLADSVVPTIRMENTTSPLENWDISASNSNFIVRDVNHEGDPFIIRVTAPTNTLVLDSTGRIGLGVASPLYQIHHSSGARLDTGVWVDASSRKVKQDIHALDSKSAFDALQALQPVTFEYKANPSDTHVGFIAEDVPELVATPDRTGIAPMDIVGVLTKVVKEQQKTIEELRTRLDRLEQR
ncbi:MAG TPA: tail fiber domain-containing protein [Thermoanaerobaculia bacterium]|nr:tail fiber domain-containing protein [Thermoanaerobaculia bacterium]